jgi:hypothetical protein
VERKVHFVLELVLRGVDVAFHHVVELVGAGVVEDFLVRQHHRDRDHLGAELGVVEQLGRRRVEEVIAVVPDGRTGLVVEQPFPDDRARILLPLVLLLQHREQRVGVRHQVLVAARAVLERERQDLLVFLNRS